MTFVWNPKKWKPVTQKLVGLLLAGSVATQAKWVTDHVLPLVDKHPHLAFLGPLLIGIITLIHNPLAQNIVTQTFSTESVDQQGQLQKKTTETTIEAPKQ